MGRAMALASADYAQQHLETGFWPRHQARITGRAIGPRGA